MDKPVLKTFGIGEIYETVWASLIIVSFNKFFLFHNVFVMPLVYVL
jgi:hypothetical protein